MIREASKLDVLWAIAAQDDNLYSHYTDSPGQPCLRCGQLPRDSTVTGGWSPTIGAPLCPLSPTFWKIGESVRRHPAGDRRRVPRGDGAA